MGERASLHAHQFSWQRSMEELFGRVYVDAFAARAAALRKRGSTAAFEEDAEQLRGAR
jgi:hypothetical protein